MIGGYKLESFPDQIGCQAVDVEDKLLSFSCFVPQSGVDTLLRVSIKLADAQHGEVP